MLKMHGIAIKLKEQAIEMEAQVKQQRHDDKAIKK
jgi:hypothetical protein